MLSILDKHKPVQEVRSSSWSNLEEELEKYNPLHHVSQHCIAKGYCKVICVPFEGDFVIPQDGFAECLRAVSQLQNELQQWNLCPKVSKGGLICRKERNINSKLGIGFQIGDFATKYSQ